MKAGGRERNLSFSRRNDAKAALPGKRRGKETIVTPKEIVQRTLDFEHPERVARSFKYNGSVSDFVHSGPNFGPREEKWRRVDDKYWERKDVWGNTWGRIDETSKGEIVRGALADISQAADFPLPDCTDPELYKRAAENYASRPDFWSIGGVHGLTFSVARKIRKLDQYLMDLVTEPEAIEILHDRVDECIAAQIRGLASAGARAIMFGEDWGTQQALMISPAMWREKFKPRFARFCRLAHELGMRLFMHSCGKITDIIPDLIEVGVDLFQFDQPRLHGLDTLAAFQDNAKVTFWCPVDIQTTLQTKDEEKIRADADLMLEKLWRNGRGGFVAGYYGDNASIGLEPKWQEFACDEFLKKGQAAD